MEIESQEKKKTEHKNQNGIDRQIAFLATFNQNTIRWAVPSSISGLQLNIVR